jgi:hypothetical protein
MLPSITIAPQPGEAYQSPSWNQMPHLQRSSRPRELGVNVIYSSISTAKMEIVEASDTCLSTMIVQTQ